MALVLQRVGKMTCPRAAAIAELGWSSPLRRSWPDFVKRFATQFGRYDTLKIPCADSGFAVFPQVELDSVSGVVAAVGQVPFNFQIGEDVKKSALPHRQRPKASSRFILATAMARSLPDCHWRRRSRRTV